jgi:hypothetical protein
MKPMHIVSSAAPKIRKLLLLGNGFDLAHGLPTRYTDFLEWWLNNKSDKLKESSRAFSDKDVSISHEESQMKPYLMQQQWSLDSIQKIIGVSPFKWNNQFLRQLLYNYDSDKGWVDIEEEYYKSLKDAFKNGQPIETVKKLNQDLDSITNLLKDYLASTEMTQAINSISWNFGEQFDHFSQNDLVVNFNYTNTFDKYFTSKRTSARQPNTIPIHGSLSNAKKYPIIFGYGDEVDENYHHMQKENNNEWLKQFKSFKYARAPYYRKLLGFINTNEYEVEVIGMSLGLSDRVLFSTIFDNENCQSIKLRCTSIEDFDDKVFNLSRHFEKPSTFRAKVLDFKEEFLIK